MHSEFVKIPIERIGALIGKAGSTKNKIEEKTGAKLKIDSIEGEIEIVVKEVSENFFTAKNIVTAIGRGFSPERAFRLFEADCYLSVLELTDSAATKRELFHKKGRIIGTKGRAREEIEEETGASICVFGKTVAIIGTEEEIEKARKAVEMLLQGASHEMVYDSLKKAGQKKFEL